MSILKIEIEVSNFGEAQDRLRKIIAELNQAKASGNGWSVGAGEIKYETPKIEGLEPLAKELQVLLSDEDLSDEMLREASEALLPGLCEVLFAAGYGDAESLERLRKAKQAQNDAEVESGDSIAPEGTGEAVYRFTRDWSGDMSDRKQGDELTASELGDGVIFKDLLESGTIELVPRETFDKKAGFKFPWEKNKRK